MRASLRGRCAPRGHDRARVARRRSHAFANLRQPAKPLLRVPSAAEVHRLMMDHRKSTDEPRRNEKARPPPGDRSSDLLKLVRSSRLGLTCVDALFRRGCPQVKGARATGGYRFQRGSLPPLRPGPGDHLPGERRRRRRHRRRPPPPDVRGSISICHTGFILGRAVMRLGENRCRVLARGRRPRWCRLFVRSGRRPSR